MFLSNIIAITAFFPMKNGKGSSILLRSLVGPYGPTLILGSFYFRTRRGTKNHFNRLSFDMFSEYIFIRIANGVLSSVAIYFFP